MNREGKANLNAVKAYERIRLDADEGVPHFMRETYIPGNLSPKDHDAHMTAMTKMFDRLVQELVLCKPQSPTGRTHDDEWSPKIWWRSGKEKA